MSSIFSDQTSIWQVYCTVYALVLLRYLLFSGLAMFVVWFLLGNRLKHRLIQKERTKKEKIYHEIKYSLITFFIFAFTGVGVYLARTSGITLMYTDIQQYGMTYFLFSIIILILAHDAYFYWAHRAMHHKWLFKKMHLVHHKTTNPSPWAAFAFHPYEAIVEAGIVPIMIFVLPLHPLAILVFLLFMTALNVLGHLGYELYPHGFTKHPILGLNNTATHHNMHHKYFNCNYGLYFNYWDRIMGTNHKNYHQTFDEITSRTPQKENTVLKEG